MNYLYSIIGCFILLLGGCASLPLTPTVGTLPPVPMPTARPSPTTPSPFTDAGAVMAGICFEAAFDAEGQVFVLRDAEDHIRFYDLADNSTLCRRPVERVPFDFSGGRVLAGLWSAGTGCTARHDVLDYTRDPTAETITLRLRFSTEGDCNYDLVRPFWVAIPDAGDDAVEIIVE